MAYVKLYDLVGFKICWVLCAFCSVWGNPYLGPLATSIFILGHLFMVQINMYYQFRYHVRECVF